MEWIGSRRMIAIPESRYPAIPFLMLFVLSLTVVPGPSAAKETRGIVTVKVDLNAPAGAKQVRLWIPYPMSDEQQEITDVSIRGNYSTMGVYREGRQGESILFAEWAAPSPKRTMTYSFRVVRKETSRKEFPATELPFSREELAPYLSPTRRGPTDGEVAAGSPRGNPRCGRRREPCTTGSWTTCTGTRR